MAAQKKPGPIAAALQPRPDAMLDPDQLFHSLRGQLTNLSVARASVAQVVEQITGAWKSYDQDEYMALGNHINGMLTEAANLLKKAAQIGARAHEATMTARQEEKRAKVGMESLIGG